MARKSQGLRYTMVFRLPFELHEQLAREAKEKKVNLTAYLVRLIVQGREQGSPHDALQNPRQSDQG